VSGKRRTMVADAPGTTVVFPHQPNHGKIMAVRRVRITHLLCRGGFRFQPRQILYHPSRH